MTLTSIQAYQNVSLWLSILTGNQTITFLIPTGTGEIIFFQNQFSVIRSVPVSIDKTLHSNFNDNQYQGTVSCSVT